MPNCSGTTIPTGTCVSSSSPRTVTQRNCSCTPCDTPVIINQGDVSTQVLVPVLADVIQNCASITKYETAFPNNWIFETNLPKAPTGLGQTPPSGTICINNVNYSYSCLGVPGEAGVDATTLGTPPTIDASVGGSAVTLTADTLSCSCLTAGNALVGIYNNFSGTVTTPACCCNQVAQAYSQAKVIERGINFQICNLNVTLTGTIGGQPFTANLAGINPDSTVTTGVEPVPFAPSVPLGANTDDDNPGLLFSTPFNFAEIMCLPTSTRLNIIEEFDSCLSVDCIRPAVSTYTVATDPTEAAVTNASFQASADLSLIITKNIYATTSEKLAVMTNSGAQVVCTSGNMPTCPQGSPCGGPCSETATGPCYKITNCDGTPITPGTI